MLSLYLIVLGTTLQKVKRTSPMVERGLGLLCILASLRFKDCHRQQDSQARCEEEARRQTKAVKGNCQGSS